MKILIELSLDGYENEADQYVACKKFVIEQLNTTASSIEILWTEPLKPATDRGVSKEIDQSNFLWLRDCYWQLKNAYDRHRHALFTARTAIKALHGEPGWPQYQHSPEMKEINDTLGRGCNECGSELHIHNSWCGRAKIGPVPDASQSNVASQEKEKTSASPTHADTKEKNFETKH